MRSLLCTPRVDKDIEIVFCSACIILYKKKVVE